MDVSTRVSFGLIRLTSFFLQILKYHGTRCNLVTFPPVERDWNFLEKEQSRLCSLLSCIASPCLRKREKQTGPRGISPMQPFPVLRYVYLSISANTTILLYLQHRGNRTKGNRKGRKKEKKENGKRKRKEKIRIGVRSAARMHWTRSSHEQRGLD